ncbi:hypothetical protein [Jonesia quinghaiensis]|uniref:hypothetical protein n=1 Tax=Jonesia quinghaiensis TaxID=262806 RepID=UPI00042A8448|nr:hypothetical protein [Jonesia quinghaiensis]
MSALLLCLMPGASAVSSPTPHVQLELPPVPCQSAPAGQNGTGIFASLHDIGSSSSQLRCRAGHLTFALRTGNDARASAQAQGARCEQVPVTDDTLVMSQLWVCSPYDGLLSARGGTTYGLTFLTPTPLDDVRSNRNLINHEARHAVQWLRYGATMPLAYARGGSDPCANPFEIDAGLLDGGYQC